MKGENTTTCFLCSKPAEMMGSVGGCHQLYCSNCGQYLIAIPVEGYFEINPEYKKKRPVLSGMAFEANYYKDKVLQITPDLLEKAKDISLHDKLFKLATYFYNEAKEENSSLNQNPACCYESNNKKYSDLMKMLKRIEILNFILAEDDSKDYVSNFLEIEMTISAMLIFEKGINTLNDFEEAFMNNGKNKSSIKIGDNAKQVNVAMDNGTVIATQNNNPDLHELQNLFDCLIRQIPDNASKEVREQINEGLATIKSELQKQQPSKGTMNLIMSGVKGLFSTTGFVASAMSIIDFIAKSVH
jgi:hypothetical protein